MYRKLPCRQTHQFEKSSPRFRKPYDKSARLGCGTLTAALPVSQTAVEANFAASDFHLFCQPPDAVVERTEPRIQRG